VKRFDLWKAKLKVAKAELRIRNRELNAAVRAYHKCRKEILVLENKIDNYLAKP